MTELVRCPVCHENVGRHLGCARVLLGDDQPAGCILAYKPVQALPARDERGRLLPGHTANPDGRPAVVRPIRELARAEGEASIRKLVEIRDGTDKGLALHAANALLDRGYGKPPQAIVGDDDAPPVRVDGLTRLDERCLALVRELLHLDPAEEPER